MIFQKENENEKEEKLPPAVASIMQIKQVKNGAEIAREAKERQKSGREEERARDRERDGERERHCKLQLMMNPIHLTAFQHDAGEMRWQ